ncbi:hypothetical protein Btru_074498 [Bulinus truncatus]|nr:hypothetical protein Btru_074498 [Bulinus truncatus]
MPQQLYFHLKRFKELRPCPCMHQDNFNFFSPPSVYDQREATDDYKENYLPPLDPFYFKFQRQSTPDMLLGSRNFQDQYVTQRVVSVLMLLVQLYHELDVMTCTRSYDNCLSRHVRGHITTASVDDMYGHITTASVDMYRGHITTASVELYEGLALLPQLTFHSHIKTASVDMYQRSYHNCFSCMYEGHITTASVDMYEVI